MLIHFGFAIGFVFLTVFILQMRTFQLGYAGAFAALKQQHEASATDENDDSTFIVRPLFDEPKAPSQLPALLAFAGFAIAWAGYAVKGN